MTYNKKLLNEDIITRNILNNIRSKKDLIKESESNNNIPITNDPKFGQEVLKNQISEFRTTVDGGTQFDNENSTSESPLVYMPSNGDLIFSGTIPSLNQLKWQFRLKDSDGVGLFIWSDALRLNKENIQKLNKLFGYYQNWKAQWEQSIGSLENITKNIE